jgi:hypothetical protein
MPIQKVLDLLSKVRKKRQVNKNLVIKSVRPESTIVGRKKIEILKKIGQEKRKS